MVLGVKCELNPPSPRLPPSLELWWTSRRDSLLCAARRRCYTGGKRGRWPCNSRIDRTAGYLPGIPPYNPAFKDEGVLWRAEEARKHVFLRNEPDWKMVNLRQICHSGNGLDVSGRFFQSGSFGVELGVRRRVAGLTFPV